MVNLGFKARVSFVAATRVYEITDKHRPRQLLSNLA
jgi:hypothetical protein